MFRKGSKNIISKVMPASAAIGILAIVGTMGACNIDHHSNIVYTKGATKQIIGRPSTERYHEIKTTNTGFIATIGACVDELDRDGRPLDPNNHCNRDAGHGQEVYIGHDKTAVKWGALYNIVGRPDKEAYHDIKATKNGFKVTLAGCQDVLDKKGRSLNGNRCVFK